MVERKALVIKPKDNVANALENVKRGEVVEVNIGSNRLKMTLLSDVPFGHKFAIRRILFGEDIVKYGEVIGRATRIIRKGEHVHVHNVEGLRARGDLIKRL